MANSMKRIRFGRSISLTAPPKRNSAPLQPTLPISLRKYKPPSLKTKLVKFLTTKMFLNQVDSNSVQFAQNSSFNFFFNFMRIIGASFRGHKKESKKLIVFLMIYNFLIFNAQLLYLPLLLFGLYQNSTDYLRWTNVTHISSLLLCVLAIWSNVKMHLIKPKLFHESLSSSSLNERHIDKRRFLITLLSLLCISVIIITTIIVEGIRINGNDRFGIFSSATNRFPVVFTCGTPCRFVETFLHSICVIYVLTLTMLFVILSTAVSSEATEVAVDIKKYPTSQGLDHLIYRYQSVERSSRILDQIYSSFILILTIFSAASIIFCLRKKAKVMITENEIGGINILTAMIIFVMATSALLIFSIYLNEQLEEFRSSAHKVSDYSQADFFHVTSVKLLSFMLRLSDNRERIKCGGIFIITKQSIITLTLFFVLIGFCFFAVDEGCFNVL